MESQQKPLDFLTPEQAKEKLSSMGYGLKFVPKDNHNIQALNFIANSSNGASWSETVKELQIHDPKHAKKLRDYKKIKSQKNK